MSHQLSKHFEFRQKYSSARRISTLLSVFGYLDETLSLVFDAMFQTRVRVFTWVSKPEKTENFIVFECLETPVKHETRALNRRLIANKRKNENKRTEESKSHISM